MGKFVQLIDNGRVIDFEKPNPANINPKDIIDRLKNIKRFHGQPGALTVYEHTQLCIRIWEDIQFFYFHTGKNLLKSSYSKNTHNRLLAEIIIHDFHEAYTSDIPSPIKSYFPKITEIENRIDEAIKIALFKTNDLGNKFPQDCIDNVQELITAIDMYACYIEVKMINPFMNDDWVQSLKNKLVMYMDILGQPGFCERFLSFDRLSTFRSESVEYKLIPLMEQANG